LLVATGRREEALTAYQKSLAIREKLAAADPGNSDWQRDLSISHNKIGDVLVGAGRREEALAAYHKALAISEKLAAADPGNTEWQIDLVVSLHRIASAGEAKEVNLARALSILQRLDAVDALSPMQKSWIPDIEEQLKKIKARY
jgi:tetratricopeptide (TPR) repeat protein